MPSAGSAVLAGALAVTILIGAFFMTYTVNLGITHRQIDLVNASCNASVSLCEALCDATCSAVCNASTPSDLVDESDPDCDDDNECTLDVKRGVSPGWCDNLYWSKAANCTSVCYVDDATTHCDGHGGCVSDDYTECKGYCGYSDAFDSHDWVYTETGNAVNNPCLNGTLFPLAPVFQLPIYPSVGIVGLNTLFDPPVVSSYCAATQCVGTVIALSEYADPNFPDARAGVMQPILPGGVECIDLLDSDVLGDQLACIGTQTFAFTQNLSNSFVNTYLDATSGGTTYTDGSFEWVLSVCVYKYHCGQFNTTIFHDPVYYSPVDSKRFVETTASSEFMVSTHDQLMQLVRQKTTTHLSRPYNNKNWK